MQNVDCLRKVNNQSTALCRQKIICVDIEVEYFCDNLSGRLYFIKNFYLLFSNSDSNLTQIQMLTLKLFPNRTLTLILILILILT